MNHLKKKIDNYQKDTNKKMEKWINKVNNISNNNDNLLINLENNTQVNFQRQKEQYHQIDEKILQLEKEIKKIPNVKVIDIDTLDLKRKIEKIDEYIYHNMNTNRPNEKKQAPEQKVESGNDINTDLLILGDSNTKHINTKILDNNNTSKKIFCATFRDVKIVCENIKINKEPKKILLHFVYSYPER